MVSPRTFIILPFIGYTPKILRSSEESPETIPALAESPSQKMITHCLDLSVPAQFASINFGIPRMCLLLMPSVFLAALFSFTSVSAHAASITPIFASFSMNLSLTTQDEPNFALGVFMKSLVWLSNAGFSISQRKNRMSCSLMVFAFTTIFFFFSINADNFLVIWFKIYSTCLPPLLVLMPLTNETCWNSCSALRPTEYSQRPLSATSYARGLSSLGPRYMSTYCWKFFTGTAVPLYLTLSALSVTAAMSCTRFFKSPIISGDRPAIPNR